MQIPKSVVKTIHETMRTSKDTAETSKDDQNKVYEAVCKLQEKKCKEEKIFEKVAKNLSITSFKARDFYSNALNDLATEVCNLIMFVKIFFNNFVFNFYFLGPKSFFLQVF